MGLEIYTIYNCRPDFPEVPIAALIFANILFNYHCDDRHMTAIPNPIKWKLFYQVRPSQIFILISNGLIFAWLCMQ